MQMKIRERHGPFDGIGCRRRPPSTKPQRLFPTRRIGQCVVVVVGTCISAGARDRNRGDRWPAREQMDRCGARLECHSRRIERRRRGADHRHVPAVQSGEIDGGLGVGIQLGRQSLTQHGWNIRPAVAGESSAQNDPPCRFDLGVAVHVQVQSEMSVAGFDPQQFRAIADRDAEEPAVPGQVIGPVGAENAIDRRVGFDAMPCFVPRLEAECGNAEFRAGQALRRPQQNSFAPRSTRRRRAPRPRLRRSPSPCRCRRGATRRRTHFPSGRRRPP